MRDGWIQLLNERSSSENVRGEVIGHLGTTVGAVIIKIPTDIFLPVFIIIFMSFDARILVQRAERAPGAGLLSKVGVLRETSWKFSKSRSTVSQIGTGTFKNSS